MESMTMIPQTRNCSLNYGKFENSTAFGGHYRNEGSTRLRRQKYKGGDRWPIKQSFSKTKNSDPMPPAVRLRRGMHTCRSTTTKEPFTRTQRTKFSRGIIIYPLPWKCRIRLFSRPSYRKESETSERRARASIHISQLKIQAILIP